MGNKSPEPDPLVQFRIAPAAAYTVLEIKMQVKQ